MTTATDNTTKAPGNLFDEDITSLYTLELPEPQQNAYRIQVLDVSGDDERYMVNQFHQQYVAVEGRFAVAQLIDTRIGDLATHSSLVMGRAMESINRIETTAGLGCLEKRFRDFNNKLTDQTARHMLETNAIAVRTMQEDMRRSPYPPPPPAPPPPPRPKRKGLIQLGFEVLFGEL